MADIVSANAALAREVQRLESENANLRYQLIRDPSDCEDALRARIAELEAELDTAKDAVFTLTQVESVKRREARIAELEAALRRIDRLTQQAGKMPAEVIVNRVQDIARRTLTTGDPE